ncbi:unnamed protein product [Urochloa decumbens]|uniref:VQ domain-containing protein n=1 Tax=Urochloa decumbens TaxID=240449 RepID=A0ABC8YE55_9POAL
MASSSSNKKKQRAANDADAARGGGKPARTHWRQRDPADTSVYVVHPDQFRAVVQQLTGADSSPPAGHHHQAGGNGTPAAQQGQPAAGTAGTNDDARQLGRSGEENSSMGKTLRQMHDECMAWANADD